MIFVCNKIELSIINYILQSLEMQVGMSSSSLLFTIMIPVFLGTTWIGATHLLSLMG
jgi:hypothetical protein